MFFGLMKFFSPIIMIVSIIITFNWSSNDEILIICSLFVISVFTHYFGWRNNQQRKWIIPVVIVAFTILMNYSMEYSSYNLKNGEVGLLLFFAEAFVGLIFIIRPIVFLSIVGGVILSFATISIFDSLMNIQ